MAILGKASATTLEVLNSSVFAGGRVNITTEHPYITGAGDGLTLGGKKGDETRGSGTFDYTDNCFRRNSVSKGMTLGSSLWKWADVYTEKINGYTIASSVPSGAVFTDSYPTAFSWTAGTTAGPTGTLSGSGMSSVSIAAIPTASTTASGIVTTGAQNFIGEKTFSSSIALSNTATNPVSIKYINNRQADGSGGWADSIIQYRNKANEIKAHLGVFGSQNVLDYFYLGHHDYDATLNLRIHQNRLTFGQNSIYDTQIQTRSIKIPTAAADQNPSYFISQACHYNISKSGWYRIAQTAVGVDVNIGTFEVIGTVSSYHSAIKVTASMCYYNTPSITVENASSFQGSRGITSVRIVNAPGSYSGLTAYLEVYCNNPASNSSYTLKVSASSMIGWQLITSATSGDTIPTNYTSHEVPLYYKVGINTNNRIRGIYESDLQWGGDHISGNCSPTDAAMIPPLGANRLSGFWSESAITVQYSQDNGTTWTDYGATLDQKRALILGQASAAGWIIGKCSGTTSVDIKNKSRLRIIFKTINRKPYCQLNKFALNISTNGSYASTVVLYGRTQQNVSSNSNTWDELGRMTLSGWSGWNILNIKQIATYGNTPATQYGELKFEFYSTSHSTNTSYPGLTILHILGFGIPCWDSDVYLSRYGTPYVIGTDYSSQFQYPITATKFTGKIGATHNDSYYDNVMWYRCGQLTEGKSTGNVTKSLSTDCKLYSTPITNENYMNVMNLRLSWSNQYWHDIFCEPNTQDLYHRCVRYGTSGNWRIILDSENYTSYIGTGAYLPLSGGQMTGPISFPTAERGEQVLLKDGDNDIDLLTYTFYGMQAGMQAGMSLYPRSSSVNLGRSSNYWNNGYVNTLYSYQLNSDDNLSITAGLNLYLIAQNESLIINANDVISDTAIYAPAFYETSDIRKKDIKSDISLNKCYELIDKCQTIIYSLKDQTQEQIGMIAQEIEEFFPEVVATDKDGFKSLAYDRLVVICFKVLKDVIKRLEKLENEQNCN